MRETRKGSGERVAINQPSATWCIQLPMLEMNVAIQRARKRGFDSESHGL